ncbi:MAG: hypothetical protein U0941_22350 [Planctomycetaceae bacterium]
MVQYIKDLIGTLKQSQQYIVTGAATTAGQKDAPEFWTLLKGIREELDRLDPRDFLPAAQHDFVAYRTQLRMWTEQPARGRGEEPLWLAQALSAILDAYGGEDSQAETKDFVFVQDIDLRAIVVRDYKELSLKLFPDGAWKSSVVMAGSILEAILFDQLENDPAKKVLALAAGSAPKYKGVVIADLAEWKLIKLIEVAVEVGVLNPDRAKSIDQVLRDYRNFVHPKKEIRAKHPCTEAEALMSKGALDGVYNHLHP